MYIFATLQVLENWRNMFDISSEDTLWEQARVLTQISIKCMDLVPAKRPDIQCIIQWIKETERTEQFIISGMITSLMPQLRSWRILI